MKKKHNIGIKLFAITTIRGFENKQIEIICRNFETIRNKTLLYFDWERVRSIKCRLASGFEKWYIPVHIERGN